eukprot:4489296-Pyramimonas_sp.AAC.1
MGGAPNKLGGIVLLVPENVSPYCGMLRQSSSLLGVPSIALSDAGLQIGHNSFQGRSEIQSLANRPPFGTAD